MTDKLLEAIDRRPVVAAFSNSARFDLQGRGGRGIQQTPVPQDNQFGEDTP